MRKIGEEGERGEACPSKSASVIYINDIYISASKVKFRLFSDDASTCCSNKELFQLEKHLNTSLEYIFNSLKASKFTLKVKKSNLLLFFYYSSRNKKPKETINISTEDQKLAQKEYAKYLGVYIDCHLSWENTLKLRIPKFVNL